MALFPSLPLNFFPSSSSSSSSSHSFPILQARKLSPPTLNSQNFEFSHPHQTTSFENEEHPETKTTSITPTKKKKKKKLRPSFYDQTHDRWSLKITSQRSTFPWQEQEREQVKIPEFSLSISKKKSEKSLIENPITYNLSNRVVSAPWVHGLKPIKTGIDLETETRVSNDQTQVSISELSEKSSAGFVVEKLNDFSSEFESIGGKNPDILSINSGDIGRLVDSETETRVFNDQTQVSISELSGKSSVGLMVEKLKDFSYDFESIGGEKPDISLNDNGDIGRLVGLIDNGDCKTETIISSDQTQVSISELSGKSSVGLIVEKLKEFSYQFESIGGKKPDILSNNSGNIGKLVGSIDNGDPIRLPWERESASGERWKRSNTELAERMVPEPELERLRNVALRMKERTKIGDAGVTQAVVDKIHEKWKEEEVVKLKFEGAPVLNMRRTHEILERKTGGLVIWRSGSSLVLYRGMTYQLPCVQSYAKQIQDDHDIVPCSKDSTVNATWNVKLNGLVSGTEASTTSSLASFEDPTGEFMDLMDFNNVLDELGPRFKDWSGRDPQPVDADLLPCVVPGYKPPFRLLPYGIRRGLGNKEMTFFRRVARTMPPHFSLGRNRQHQGLAMAMVKLWEKSSIAKIAIKRGVRNTSNERMAEEIKQLTGGTLLSRNKEYIVFYRGNDFMSPAITEALVERQKLATVKQDEEEEARLRASALIVSNTKTVKGPFVAGTLAETVEANSRWANQPSSEDREKMMRDEAVAKQASLVRYLEKKLLHAQEKVKKAEKALGKVQEFLKPAELPSDLEIITDEERFLFRKIGLSMKPFLLVGRRGVFDGTVENMHLHWKYRELVKLIVRGKSFPQVKHFAISLEAESGGVLISLDKTTKGYAIILYRGKNYHRPSTLRPKNLLTRRQALARSIELQRREALNHHILDLHDQIEMMKSELEQMQAGKETCNKDLYSQLDDDYSSDNESEDEDEEAYLKTYYSGDEDSDTWVEEPERESIH